ncbi:4-hydroxyphenylpyruvate dioxygenase [Lyngbya aestuarii BL J]|uniref:4-hydroxyphenylpyruvate dioxygenase n=2 Tax=Lyngbya aestuarii TaxID=118322 RepID=U7QJT1_9CYAN|nr:4-hydroxyphenylpyruvate dioxygenase [Lyngbya aestuarii]ERT08224.1 4-hydroxyphenylpyruvate dioxygenase [Lyngbya aestuarii BL J]
MQFDHLHFYVTNAKASRDWFIQKLGFQAQGCVTNSDTHTEIIQQGSVYFLLSSPVTDASPVAQYLHQHPSGIVDVGFQVEDIDSVAQRMKVEGVKMMQPIQQYSVDNSVLKWFTIVGWGGLHHTLVERPNHPHWKLLPSVPFPIPYSQVYSHIVGIDHVVLNVNSGDLQAAVNWYKQVLGFKSQQTFDIQTKRSGLHSQVLVDEHKNVQFPINEPTSEKSQIQEFIDVNRGAGIQHIALKTKNIIQVVGQLRQQGLPFISVSPFYYSQLQKQLNKNELSPADWKTIQEYEILIDMSDSDAMLLQIFTQPIFDEPTFFFEFIERRTSWVNGNFVEAEGFGEGNFQALFEAMEQEQIKRSQSSNQQPNSECMKGL